MTSQPMTPVVAGSPLVERFLPRTHGASITGVGRWPRATHVWRSRAEEDAAPGAEAWNVTVQDTPMPEPGEKARQLGPFTSWAEAMEAARAEARYIVQRPARPTPYTWTRLSELRATAFTDPVDVQEVCS